MDWLGRPDGGYVLTIPKGHFSQEQHQWAQEHPQIALSVGTARNDGQAVTVEYPHSAAPLLIDHAAVMEEQMLLGALSSIARTVGDVMSSGVLKLHNLQVDSAMVKVDDRGQVLFMYAAIQPEHAEVNDALAKVLLLDLIRRTVQKFHSFQTEHGKQLLELVNDPYLTLDDVFSFLNQAGGYGMGQPAVQAQPTYQVPVQYGGNAAPGMPVYPGMQQNGVINAAVSDREMRIQPVSVSPVENAVRQALDQQLQAAPVQRNFTMPSQNTSMQNLQVTNAVNYGTASFAPEVATISSAPSSSLLNFSADTPTQDDAAYNAGKASAPAVLNFGADTPTSDEGAETSSQMLSFGADMPTSDEGGSAAQALNFGADAPTSDGDAAPGSAAPAAKAKPAKPAKPVKTEKPAKEAKPKPQKKEKAKAPRKTKEAPVQEDVPLTHEELVQRCWTSRMILMVAAIGILLLTIILCSFASPLVVLLFLLIVAVGAAFVGKQGFFGNLVMPKVEKTEPQAPTLGEVFNVRMKLQSVNLGSVVEVTIRYREQILGSSEQLASKPVLNYPGISRQHCKVICMTSAGNDTYYIEDLKSKNGTELNGMRLIPGNRYPLHYGDTLTLAHKYKFVVHSDAY